MKYEIILNNGQKTTIEAANDEELNEIAGKMNLEIFWRNYDDKKFNGNWKRNRDV